MSEHQREDPGPLPERWIHCPRKADSLFMGKFLAFKTPLGRKFDDSVPIQYRHTPFMVFDSTKYYTPASKHNERPKIGLWIDLTRTKRYYDSEEITSNNCKYMKLECHGHQGAPNMEQTETFIQLCKIFMSRDPINLIGVHCTHGFNRTGFLLISFMVSEIGCSVDAAISEFAKIRPPGIYKLDYLKELYKRYNDPDDPDPVAPPLPDWYFYDQSNELSQLNNTPNGSNRKNRRNSHFKENPTFMEGVPGTEPILDKAIVTEIRQKVGRLTEQNRESFVGSQPVSMDRQNLMLLSQKEYQVSWKADGTRYMLFIEGEDRVYFLDRDNSVFKVERLQFLSDEVKNQHLTNTLLDGEMVLDKDGNRTYPRYLVYDIVYLNNKLVGDMTFLKRLDYIHKKIIEPRREAMMRGYIRQNEEPFSVRAKAFYEIHHTRTLLSEKFAKQLSHPPDGLIFQPVDDPYTYGTSDQVLKWKPLSLNSVDFKLEVKKEQREGCLPEFIGRLLSRCGNIWGRIKCNKKLRELNGKIIECKLENKQWVFMRERTDKSFANAESTVKSVMESIEKPVDEKMLLQFIEHNRYKRPMPPPSLPPPTKRARHC